MVNTLVVADDFGVGGLQRVTAKIGQNFSDEHHVEFLSIFSKENFYLAEEPLIGISKQQYRFVRVFSKLFRITGLNSNLAFENYIFYRKIKKYIIQKNIQTVILSGGWGILTGQYLRNDFPELKIIIWIHNDFDIYLNKYYQRQKKELVLSIKSADSVVVLTESGKQKVLELSQNVERIYNPVTLDNTIGNSELNVKIISVVCRYAIEHKGIDNLILIAKTIPSDWKIAIAGTGSPKDILEVENLIQKHGVQDKIILRGPLNGIELQNHYKNSSIYIMTSRWEGFPLVLAEAMNFGLPIISFENGGSNEVLENGKYGKLVEQGNVELFSEELNRMISDIQLRKEYAVKSLQRAKSLQLDSIIKQWEKILQ
ncbi:glycosyltransferase [Leuconostoc lactis]|uniref:glycosyltransferase n=1 Tax=Leuconostoc lactis TaxID=1246 RepID=UPI0002195CD0|nr:glycosyltransferase [Leuconostoc lactis]GHC21605.1 glycosyl transferase [Leuconostoc lactis KCTC 3528 = DSM 20202]